jgi:alanyl-tRNA synthetase
MALFVKIWRIGQMASAGDFSKELCGGTHVNYSGKLDY